MEWIEAVGQEISKRKRYEIYIVTLDSLFLVGVVVVGALLKWLGIIPLSSMEMKRVVIFCAFFIQPALIVLSIYYISWYHWKKIRINMGSHYAFIHYNIIRGISIIGNVPRNDYGSMVVAPQGILYSPGRTFFSFNWSFFPRNELVSVTFKYRRKLMRKSLYLTIKMENGRTMKWQCKINAHSGLLVKYLHDNKYPLQV